MEAEKATPPMTDEIVPNPLWVAGDVSAFVVKFFFSRSVSEVHPQPWRVPYAASGWRAVVS